ncbi:MAG: arabinan endo-1,5-alpha-L-arabinosidase [Pontiellaceae bacterium]|nr:arabinan endo-1,5-alpha-L-arabinosidase [Pontiellaceae bacterium]
MDYPSRPAEQTINAHDPAVLKDGSYYYVYGTHNMPVWRSRDLVEFEQVERQLVRRLPEEAAEHVGEGGRTLWAPDIVKIGNEYRLYYCLSRFGSSQSYIGFLVGKSPTGTFKDGKEVARSSDPTEERGAPNALDPSVLMDADGKQWMVYGSFFGGIYIMRLDDDGEARSRGSVGERIAYRRGTAMEGPTIIYNPTLKEYFLFVSYDKLDSTYNVRVGRSKKPGGPYRDFKGKDLNGDEDNLPKVLNSYAFENHSGWHGPGHNSVLRDGDNYFLLHHAREVVDGRKIVHTHVRKMVFTDEGWPVVSPERYAGEEEQPIPVKDLSGKWEVLFIDPQNSEMQQAQPGLVFEKDGRLSFGAEIGEWSFKQPNSLHLKLGDRTPVSAKILPAWDWENDCKTLVFTGLSEDGVAVWGKLRD